LLRVATALARLESVTVLERCIARRLQASEGLFLGPITRAGGGETAPPVDGCLRYSAIRRDQATGAMTLYRTTREAAVLVTDTWAERGCGVLTPASHRSVLTGAEDEGEIGAFHPAHHARLRRAILDKLADFLPVGLEAVLAPDPRLTEPPYAFD
ncbi:MAG: phage tail protein, partial [Pseudomonadota bacterium]